MVVGGWWGIPINHGGRIGIRSYGQLTTGPWLGKVLHVIHKTAAVYFEMLSTMH